MFNNFFGPFPDEPLLYIFDNIIGLFHKIDSKLNSVAKDATNAKNQIDSINPVVEHKNDVNDKTATTNDAKTLNPVSSEILETTSVISMKSTMECETVSETRQVDETPQIAPQSGHNTTPRSILKTSSSMECNYSLSKVNVSKNGVQTRPKSGEKKVDSCIQLSTKRYAQTSKGFGDSVALVQNTFERKLLRSDGKHRFESILKKETKQRVIPSPRKNTYRMEQSNERFSRPHRPNKSVKLADRKIIKTEWAVTRIYTFDDDSQTYEIMKKDKVLDRNGEIERIFAIAPNQTTVAYEPLKEKAKK